MNVLKRINKMRLERNWSVYRLSLESGISQSTITNMFNRETLPSILTLEAICNAFGITMAEFFAQEEKKEAPVVSDSELLELYRSLSEQAQKSIVTLMKEMSERR